MNNFNLTATIQTANVFTYYTSTYELNGAYEDSGGGGGISNSIIGTNTNTGGVSGVVPLYLKILASIFYTFSIVLGIGGNTLVLLIVIHFRRIRNVTNFFILSLAISDLIFIILW